MWKNLLENLNGLLQENAGNGAWSSTRFVFVFTVLLSNIIIFSALTVLIIKDGKFPDVPEGILWLYAIANGVAFTGKVTQKKSEPSIRRQKKREDEEEEIDL